MQFDKPALQNLLPLIIHQHHQTSYLLLRQELPGKTEPYLPKVDNLALLAAWINTLFHFQITPINHDSPDLSCSSYHSVPSMILNFYSLHLCDILQSLQDQKSK